MSSAAQTVHRLSATNDSADLLTLRTTPDEAWAAACASGGHVYFYSNPAAGAAAETFVYNPSALGVEAATTCIDFHPTHQSTDGSYLALCGSAEGVVRQTLIDGSSQRSATGTKVRTHKEQSRAQETNNEVLACGYDASGSVYVTGGSDTKLRLYDAETSAVISTIQRSIGSHGQDTIGHNSRIYSIKFRDEMCFFSAGWESSMLLHDTRTRKPVVVYAGVHMSGDGICLLEDRGIIAAASDRNKEQLQLFDISSGGMVCPSITTSMNLYSCRIGANSSSLWVAGSQPGGVALIDVAKGIVIQEITSGFDGALFGLATFAGGHAMYACGGHGGLYRITA